MTANPTTIDLDALTAAGWDWQRTSSFVSASNGTRRMMVFASGHIEIWQEHPSEPDTVEPVLITDPVWQHALDLIRAHTTEVPHE